MGISSSIPYRKGGNGALFSHGWISSREGKENGIDISILSANIERRMKSALLFRLGGLGDLLVAFPSIFFVRKKIAPWSLTLVCREEYGLILRDTGVVDNLVSVGDPKLAPLFSSPPYSRELLSWLNEFSLILGWMHKKTSLNLEDFYGAQNAEKCHFVFHDPASQAPISSSFFHETCQFLAHEGGLNPSFDECSFLPLSSIQKEEGRRLVGAESLEHWKKIAIVHPGSGSENKCWPLENFLEVINWLSSQGYRGALVTGFVEERMENRIKDVSLPQDWLWLRNPPLLKLSGLLSVADLYLGNDSGITHLAAACGTKVFALFRKDLEALWKSNGRVSILNGDSVSDITPLSLRERVSTFDIQQKG